MNFCLGIRWGLTAYLNPRLGSKELFQILIESSLDSTTIYSLYYLSLLISQVFTSHQFDSSPYHVSLVIVMTWQNS